ncbi:MAG TPA: PIN domain-containing protein [Thermoanaerobaculia bacterium]|jgi:predicted nucleic acid-binding protein|nr:PIN domain-containing protein [Thermoanaerobaculia bacterium]
MKVYLDMCCIQRPMDTRSHVRIAVEAEAILGVLALCEANQLLLISSAALEFEAEQTPHPVRRRFAFEVLAKATTFVPVDQSVEERARFLQTQGIKPLDALHLASAEAAQAELFCTCDDRFFRRAVKVALPPTKVVLPMELIEVLGL